MATSAGQAAGADERCDRRSVAAWRSAISAGNDATGSGGDHVQHRRYPSVAHPDLDPPILGLNARIAAMAGAVTTRPSHGVRTEWRGRPGLPLRPRGGRSWWAHLEFTRINIALTILQKELEELMKCGRLVQRNRCNTRWFRMPEGSEDFRKSRSDS
jgi:hypothetical protein